MPPRISKSTQRERLIAGVIAAVNKQGYAGASLAQITAHAGVSKPTFYDHFADKDECFLAAHRDISTSLLEQIRAALADAPPERAPQTAIRRLIERAAEEPARARFIANEALAGGPRALDARDETIAAIEQAIESARAGLPAKTPTPDLPTRALIGASHWLLAQRLRRGEHDLGPLADELGGWIDGYTRPAGAHRWRTLKPGPAPGASPFRSELPSRPPQPIAPGRTRLSGSEIAQNQRLRILFAVATVAAQKGYTATTVAEIAAAARVDKRVFYTHFRDKQQAFLTAHELAFQETMAIAASGFFSAGDWPERVWQGILSSTQFMASHPLAYLVHVESHAVGDPAIQRVEDSHNAFTIFLQEGNQHAASPQSRTAMEAIVAAVFEIGYQQFRHHRATGLPRYIYPSAQLCLTPFLGPAETEKFIAQKHRAHTRKR